MSHMWEYMHMYGAASWRELSSDRSADEIKYDARSLN